MTLLVFYWAVTEKIDCVRLQCFPDGVSIYDVLIELRREFFAFSIAKVRVELRLVHEWDININVYKKLDHLCVGVELNHFIYSNSASVRKQMFDNRVCRNVCLYRIILSLCQFMWKLSLIIMDVDSPVSLKRSSSAPMINELNTTMTTASTSSSTR